MNMNEIVESLRYLKINKNIEDVTKTEINKAFKVLAKELHPDKSGDVNTKSAFQEVRTAYERLIEFLASNVESDESSDVEDLFFVQNFNKFNFPCENKGSFTILIEDHLADTWQNCLVKIFGNADIKTNSLGTEYDKIWKVQFSGTVLTLHLYNKPKNKKGSKLMIQGSKQSILCSYVFDELPRIYKSVCETAPKAIINKVKSIKKSSQSVVKCVQCSFKGDLNQIKVHIQNNHTMRPRRAVKRLPLFTPISKPSKKSKINKICVTDININSEAANDDILIAADQSRCDNSLEIVTMTDLFTCNLCQHEAETVDELNKHITSSHVASSSPDISSSKTSTADSRTPTKTITDFVSPQSLDIHCDKCSFKTSHTTELKRHMQITHKSLFVALSSEDRNVVSCELCNFRCSLNIRLKKHVEKHHAPESSNVVTCSSPVPELSVPSETNPSIQRPLAGTSKPEIEIVKTLSGQDTTSMINVL